MSLSSNSVQEVKPRYSIPNHIDLQRQRSEINEPNILHSASCSPFKAIDSRNDFSGRYFDYNMAVISYIYELRYSVQTIGAVC